MNLIYTEEAERLIAHENAQWAAYAEYPLLFEQELDEAIEEIQKQPYRPVYVNWGARRDPTATRSTRPGEGSPSPHR